MLIPETTGSKMINPAQLSVIKTNGTSIKIIVEPVLTQQGKDLRPTGVYKLYKDAFGDESALFIEPLEINESNSGLRDSENPDYLGTLTLTENNGHRYEGDLLGADEQSQVVDYIKKHK